MVLEEIHDIDEGVSRFSDALIEEEYQQFRTLWEHIQPMDKALLTLIARGDQKGLYSDDYKAKLQAIYPELDPPRNSSIQNAVNRLKNNPLNAIYSSEHGIWRFADPAFEQFVRTRDESTDEFE
jgi:hypothetical protein